MSNPFCRKAGWAAGSIPFYAGVFSPFSQVPGSSWKSFPDEEEQLRGTSAAGGSGRRAGSGWGKNEDRRTDTGWREGVESKQVDSRGSSHCWMFSWRSWFLWLFIFFYLSKRIVAVGGGGFSPRPHCHLTSAWYLLWNESVVCWSM